MQLTHDQPSRDAIWARALDARDPRFDGIFFVGITSTMIYCRPVCPARVSHPEHRRFFETAAAAEHAGFRPCLRCRPELAPGRAVCDAVSRLARVAALRIAAGALNGARVPDLAHELGVSERHLRRALEREFGVSPVTLAQTHRLLLAKQLLTDTSLSVTRIAFTSGFQSLRRFNAVFRERYRLSPSDLRRPAATVPPDNVRLTLAYRPPLAWHALLAVLAEDALPGVELVRNDVYTRTMRVEGQTGVVVVRNAAQGGANPHLMVDISAGLVPVLMPLLAGLRRLFDLDAEPTVVDDHLAQSGLDERVRRQPGLRVPGALDGFEAALAVLLGSASRHVVFALGEPVDTATPGLCRTVPTAARVADTGVAGLMQLGLSRRRGAAVVAVARALTSGELRLDPGGDPIAVRQALLALAGLGRRAADRIVMRALQSPDVMPGSDPALHRAAGVSSTGEFLVMARAWQPWRAYAAMHLRLDIAPSRDRGSGTRPQCSARDQGGHGLHNATGFRPRTVRIARGF
jgi:AraC family transcriptional regulator of adaptative response / DNA-3-methyladenine glycosylase II